MLPSSASLLHYLFIPIKVAQIPLCSSLLIFNSYGPLRREAESVSVSVSPLALSRISDLRRAADVLIQMNPSAVPCHLEVSISHVQRRWCDVRYAGNPNVWLRVLAQQW